MAMPRLNRGLFLAHEVDGKPVFGPVGIYEKDGNRVGYLIGGSLQIDSKVGDVTTVTVSGFFSCSPD